MLSVSGNSRNTQMPWLVQFASEIVSRLVSLHINAPLFPPPSFPFSLSVLHSLAISLGLGFLVWGQAHEEFCSLWARVESLLLLRVLLCRFKYFCEFEFEFESWVRVWHRSNKCVMAMSSEWNGFPYCPVSWMPVRERILYCGTLTSKWFGSKYSCPFEYLWKLKYCNYFTCLFVE